MLLNNLLEKCNYLYATRIMVMPSHRAACYLTFFYDGKTVTNNLELFNLPDVIYTNDGLLLRGYCLRVNIDRLKLKLFSYLECAK